MPSTFSNQVNPMGTSTKSTSSSPLKVSSNFKFPSSASAIASGIKIAPGGQVLTVPKTTTNTVKTNTPTVATQPYKAPVASSTQSYNAPIIPQISKTNTSTTPVKTDDIDTTQRGIINSLLKRLEGKDKEVGRSVEALKKFREAASDTVADIYSAPTSARVMQGRSQAVQQANAVKEAALVDAAGQALEARGQEFNALQGLVNSTTPQQIAPGSTLVSPTTGETIAGGLGGYADYNTAEKVMGLVSQYPDINYTYNKNLTPQENYAQVQQKLQLSPTYQKSTFGVPGAQSVAGAAGTQAAQQGYQDATITYNNLATQIQTADDTANNLLGIMSAGGINPTDARFVNLPINKVIRQLSSPEQAAFNTALEGVKGAFSSILQSQGGQTNSQAGQAYQTILDPNASVGSITAAINVLKQEGALKLQSQRGLVENYYRQLQSGTPSSTGVGTSWADL